MSQTSTPVGPTMLGGLPPPPGITPDFVNPYSTADTLRAIGATCIVLTTLTTATRLYTKCYIIKARGWEDYVVFIAWAGFVAYNAVALQALNYGAGIHQWDVPITKLTSFAQWENVSEILNPPLTAVTKLSICLQFGHIFVLNRDKKFWFLQGFICVNMLYFTAFFFATIFQCAPRAKIWNPELPGTCINFQAYILATGVFNLVSDFLMLVFPIFCIWSLQMSTKRKLEVSAVFLIGSLALTASILRVVFSGINNGSRDQTFTLSQVAICTVGEIAAGILVGNLVVFPRFFATFSPKYQRLFSKYGSRRSNKLLPDVRLNKASPSWSTRTPSTNPLASWPDENFAKTLPGDYVELKDQGYTVGGPFPYAGGGFPPITSSTAHSGNHGIQPHEITRSENEPEEGSRIWKTVHVSQNARHV